MPTTTSWAFPPSTERLQLDEKWSYVYKKEKNCCQDDLDDYLYHGDQWDFVALDPDNRLILSALVGKRLQENAEYLLEDVKQRLGGRTPERITTDELSAYEEAIRKVFGEMAPQRPEGSADAALQQGLVGASGGELLHLYSYNFCWAVRTLRVYDEAAGRYRPRTPAMAAGLADHIWSVKEWITFPAFQRREAT